MTPPTANLMDPVVQRHHTQAPVSKWRSEPLRRFLLTGFSDLTWFRDLNWLVVAILVFITALGNASQGVVLQQDVRIDSGFVVIESDLRSPAAPDRAWQVLTDFDGLARYVPSMDSSFVVERKDSTWTVQQVFTTRLVLPWTFRTLLCFVDDPERRVLRFEQVSGSLHDYSGTWSLSPDAPGTGVLIRYQARARLRQPVPGFIVRYIVGRHLQSMLQALTAELAADPQPVAFDTEQDPRPDRRRPGAAQ